MKNSFYELAKKNEQAIVDFMKDVVSTPSLSSQEGAVVKRMAEEMKKIGYDEVTIDGMGNLIGRMGNGPVKIAFDGHCDTVDVGNASLWTREPFQAVVENGILYGRGASDQKGGVVSSIYAAALLKQAGGVPKNATVYVVASVQEEDCDGLCWQYIVAEDKLVPDVVCLTEPTSLRIYRGHRGRMEIEVATSGISCHGSAPERGVNAVYKMAAIIQDIEKLNERLPPRDPLGKGTVTISHIRSTSPSLCAVADGCTIHLDRRLTVGETEATSVKELRELPSVKAAGATVTVLDYAVPSWKGLTYPTKKYYPTWQFPSDSKPVQRAVAGFKNTFESDPEVGFWTFSTNGIATAGMFDIPTIGFGPGHEKFAHFPDEQIEIEHLVRAAAFYAGFVTEFAKA